MCENLSCNWPFKGTNGSIIPGKVEEVKQEVGKQVKEELVEVHQNDKEVAVCGNSRERRRRKGRSEARRPSTGSTPEQVILWERLRTRWRRPTRRWRSLGARKASLLH